RFSRDWSSDVCSSDLGEVLVNIGGVDSLFTVNYDYFVAQPVIRVTSEVVNNLYANSANELMIDVPALGNAYAPEFTVTGGQAIRSEERSVGQGGRNRA